MPTPQTMETNTHRPTTANVLDAMILFATKYEGTETVDHIDARTIQAILLRWELERTELGG